MIGRGSGDYVIVQKRASAKIPLNAVHVKTRIRPRIVTSELHSKLCLSLSVAICIDCCTNFDLVCLKFHLFLESS